MGLINGTVVLENDYDTWKSMFDNEKAFLEKIFKDDSFVIEHVGSTAVKGLAAKPIVDIAVGINSFDKLNKYKSTLKNYYTIKENIENKEILLIKEKENETIFLIHIILLNDNRYKNMIKFRDILINNNDVLKEYELLKQTLSKKYANDRKMYTKSKTDFIEKVLKTIC